MLYKSRFTYLLTYLLDNEPFISMHCVVCNVVLIQVTGSDKENKQADRSLNVSSSHAADSTSPVVVSLPSTTSLSGVASAGVPVTSSHCTPVVGGTSLLTGGGGGGGDFLSGISRFVQDVMVLQDLIFHSCILHFFVLHFHSSLVRSVPNVAKRSI